MSPHTHPYFLIKLFNFSGLGITMWCQVFDGRGHCLPCVLPPSWSDSGQLIGLGDIRVTFKLPLFKPNEVLHII